MSAGLLAEDVAAIRGRISSGIVSEALCSNSTISTNSAILDARFASRESVRVGGIQAVLCAPIGRSAATGVIYLERDSDRPFTAEDRERGRIVRESAGAPRRSYPGASASRQCDRRNAGAPIPIPARRDRGTQSRHGPCPGSGHAGGAARHQRAVDRRLRDRKEPARGRDPPQQQARERPLHRGELRGCSVRPVRSRVVRGR